MNHKLTLFLMISAFTFGCSHKAPASLSQVDSKTQQEIKATVEKIYQTFVTKNAAELEGQHLYDSQFSKFEIFGKDLLNAEQTKLGETQAVTLMIKKFNFDPAKNIENLKISTYGTTAIASFILHYNAELNPSKKLITPIRSSLVFVKDNGQWKIVHEHFSLPIEMKDLPIKD